jgi:Protein of unknown function (DUF3667)
MSHSKFHHPHCLNCHYPLAEFDKFCPNCGQKPVAPKAAMHDLMHEFIHSNFHLDGKFFSTLKHIFIPGKLTEEFFKGHHKRYAHPIQLYLVLGGLFLLMMTSIAGKAEAKFQKQLDESQTDRKMRRLLSKMDSSAQGMTAYKEDPSVKKAIDSLLMQQFVKVGKRSELTAARQGYVECKEALFTQQLKIIRFKEQLSPELTPEMREKRLMLLRNYEKEYLKLQNDSATLVRNYSELELTSMRVALSSLETYFSLQYVGKKIKGEDDYNGKWLKDAEKDIKSDIESDLAAKNDASKTFMDGFNDTEKQIKKDSLNEKVEKIRNLKMRLKKPDSIQVLFFNSPVKVAQNDLLDLENDEIIQKYKIEGFWNIRFAKRFILMRQQGGAMLHTFMGKFLWIISFSLLPTAAFMYLLYWRQKRYFSEHVVWLLHINCLIFILFPLVGIATVYHESDVADWIILPFLIGAFIAPFVALKRYYKQSWGKTIVKGFIFQTVYSVIGALTFLLGGLVSFLFL